MLLYQKLRLDTGVELPFFVTILLFSLYLQVSRRKLSNKSIFIHTAPFNYYEFWLNHTIYRTLLFPKYGIFKKTSELAISIKKCEVSLLKECMYVCKHTFEVNLYSVKKMRQKVKSQVQFFCEVRSTWSHDQELVFFQNQTINQFFKL